jgi:hypothetical protein
LEKKQP